MKIGSVVIECNQFDKMLAFWSEALHYAPKRPPEDGWVILQDTSGRSPNVSLQQVPEKPSGKNRFHFDLYTNDQAGEVERLVALGAMRHPRTPEPDEDFVVLKDPDGNLFCVVDTSNA